MEEVIAISHCLSVVWMEWLRRPQESGHCRCGPTDEFSCAFPEYFAAVDVALRKVGCNNWRSPLQCSHQAAHLGIDCPDPCAGRPALAVCH